MQWDSRKYLQYSGERTQPAIDLANRLVFATDPDSLVDIGCGPGNSTAILRARFPEARVLGLDNSENMLERAKAQYGDSIEFRLCDVASGLSGISERFDVVFSNACLQWVPEHRRVLPELFGMLKPGGILAVQMPRNGDSPLFRVMDEVVSSPKWNFDGTEATFNSALEPEEYFDILAGLSDDFNIWETVYYHRMKSHEALVDWIKGTRLRPYLNRLDESRQLELEREIVNGIKPLYPVQQNGEIIYKFRRLFFTAKHTKN